MDKSEEQAHVHERAGVSTAISSERASNALSPGTLDATLSWGRAGQTEQSVGLRDRPMSTAERQASGTSAGPIPHPANPEPQVFKPGELVPVADHSKAHLNGADIF